MSENLKMLQKKHFFFFAKKENLPKYLYCSWYDGFLPPKNFSRMPHSELLGTAVDPETKQMSPINLLGLWAC